MLLLLFALLSSRSPVFQYLQRRIEVDLNASFLQGGRLLSRSSESCSATYKMLLLALKGSRCHHVIPGSGNQECQGHHGFLEQPQSTSLSTRSPARRESVVTTIREAPWAGLCGMDTLWPNTLEISLRVQGREGSAGAIQLASNHRNVPLNDPMPAVPKALWVVGKGQIYIRST